VRLSLDDLTVQDSWKITLIDYQTNADADWGSSPTLFSDATGRLLVGASQKDGNYYAFDRSNLAKGPVWIAPIAKGGDCPQCSDGSISTASFDDARLYVGGGGVLEDGTPVPGAVSCLDPTTGELLWRYFLAGGPVLAPIASANGVVFAAGGKSCVALDAATGTLLWASRAAAPIYGGVAISDGRIFFGDTAGNVFTFGVAAP
jgi:outer membrane protein assembly factor BamB